MNFGRCREKTQEETDFSGIRSTVGTSKIINKYQQYMNIKGADLQERAVLCPENLRMWSCALAHRCYLQEKIGGYDLFDVHSPQFSNDVKQKRNEL